MYTVGQWALLWLRDLGEDKWLNNKGEVSIPLPSIEKRSFLLGETPNSINRLQATDPFYINIECLFFQSHDDKSLLINPCI